MSGTVNRDPDDLSVTLFLLFLRQMIFGKFCRRTSRICGAICCGLIVLLFLILLGILPIGWILYPQSRKLAGESQEIGIIHPPVVHSHDEIGQETNNGDAVVHMKIDIIGDAAIAWYLWEHILKGKTVSKQEGKLIYGFLKHGSFSVKFFAGPSIQPTPDVFLGMENVVLVLNGRTQEKVDRSRKYLELIPKIASVKNVAVLLLGSEQCENEWLLWYLESEQYKIRAVFVVYDSRLVDNVRVFQWPLGVATYRGFPRIDLEDNDLLESRRYLCHFMGTVYRNNSRMDLMKALNITSQKDRCFLKVRYDWPEEETFQSSSEYLASLRDSDVVLSPLGMNSECYRIYEALSSGVLPIIEDQRSPGTCDKPYRLLKEYNVPAIFVEHWDELPSIMDYLASLSDTELLHQRSKLVKWYRKFLKSMADTLFRVLERNFVV